MKRKIILMLSAVMALASCTKDETTTISTPNGVSFELNGIRSRVSDGRFDLNDEIFVTAYENGLFFKSTDYVYEGDNTFGSDYPFSYAGDTPLSLSYIATYPSKYNTPSFTAVAAADQSTAEAYEMSDVLVAKTDPTDSEKPTLTFYHVMSNLVIKMNVTNLSNEPIEYSDVKFKAMLSQFCDTDSENYINTIDATAQEVTPLALTEDRYSMVLASGQTLYLNGDFGSVMIDGVEYNMPDVTGADVTLKSGYMDKYTWTLQIDGGTVLSNKVEKITGSLNDWDYDEGSSTPDPDPDPDPTPSGDNLLETAGWDVGAESGIGGWVNFDAWGAYGSASISSTQYHSGTKSTFIQAPVGDQFIGSYRGTDNAQMLVPVTAGTTYTIGAWFYVTSLPTTPNISIKVGEGVTNAVYTSVPFTDVTANTWVYKSIEVTAIATESTEIILLANNIANSTVFEFYIDDIEMTVTDSTSGGDTSGDTPSTGVNLLESAGWDVGLEGTDAEWFVNASWGGVGTITNNSTTQKHGGSYSTFMQAAVGEKLISGYRGTADYVAKTVSVTAGTTYTFGMWIYLSSKPTTPDLCFVIGASTNAVYTSIPVSGVTANTWTYVSADVTTLATESTTILFIATNTAGDAAFDFYIDDLELTTAGSSSSGDTSTSGTELLSAAGYDTSFESASTGVYTDLVWGGNFATTGYTMTNNTTAAAHTGSMSTYFSINDGGLGCAVAYRTPAGAQIPITGLTTGTYTVSFWIYVTSHSGGTSGGPGIGFDYTATGHSADFPTANTTWVGATDAPLNTWTQLSVDITVDTTEITELILRTVNYGTGNFSFYLDDISLTKM